MKKFLLILFLLIFQVAYSQISINKTYRNFSTDCDDVFAYGYGSGSPLDYTAGRVYIYFAFTAGATHHAGFVNVGSGSATWTEILDFGDATRRIEVFIFAPTTTIIGESAANIGSFGSTCTAHSSAIWELSGVPTGNNGLDAIVQTVIQTPTTSANPSLTLANPLHSRSHAVIAGFFNNQNPFGATVESGWTSDFNTGCTTPDTGTCVMSWIPSFSGDNTPSTVAASSDWLGFAIELRPTKRSVMVTR